MSLSILRTSHITVIVPPESGSLGICIIIDNESGELKYTGPGRVLPVLSCLSNVMCIGDIIKAINSTFPPLRINEENYKVELPRFVSSLLV